MGEISVPPSASDAMDNRPVPPLGLPELMLQKMGYYQHLVYVTIGLLASPLVVLYPICRQYCDADSCRYYRSITFYILVFFFLFIIWRAMNRKEKEDSDAMSMIGTRHKREERAEKV
ncbi:hypothetical protein N7537_009764 [Penicillium hordei]|uniref:Uncharacterized protein n=1 Tax=Penicillium hordei TaxID=40994 RepID=A0AAD6GXG0_9EURO|nr:uncharacterized protein N7537_009764 [Penicillium hordei]KAJ5592860.1 hypothetical protein N7537_009764 [Penicillium hordei]